MSLKRIVLIILTLFVLVFTAAAVSADELSSSSFTYQGQLSYKGALANGSFDFQFSLYSASTGGTQIGSTNTLSGVTVSQGFFTVQLDFGASAFDGNARWLEISVRPAGSGTYTTLSPRQEVAPAPYSIFSGDTAALQSYPVDTTAPTSGQALVWNGSAWAPASVSSSAWGLTGNTGTSYGTNFIGTTDDVALDIRVNNAPVLRLIPDATSPNIIGGYSGNIIDAGISGGVIGGGGEAGAYNWITVGDFATIGGGSDNWNQNSYATVSGGYRNTTSGQYSTVGGGFFNGAGSKGATVGGGENCQATNNYATISGGFFNDATGLQSTVGGGFENLSSAKNATVSGGWENTASGDESTVSGGQDNTASNSYTTVGGGFTNSASGNTSTIGGGSTNTASSDYAAIGGGFTNTASAVYTTIGGGINNIASWRYGTVAGGDTNTAGGSWSTVGGGFNNTASEWYSTISGGVDNIANTKGATVGGGESNTASGEHATVAGGFTNAAKSNYATVGGGESNTATGGWSSVGGGSNNTASGNYTTVAGGQSNTATGSHSFAAGQNATATNQGCFVWSDVSGGTAVNCKTNNRTLFKSTGGFEIFTSTDLSTGVYLNNGDSAWKTLSDVNLKENFAPVDTQALLENLVAIDIQSWNYIAQNDSMRHIGPTAQDFYAAFGMGDDDTHISTIDPDGVALAAIQGVYEIVQEKDAQLSEQQTQIDDLEARLSRLEANLAKNGSSQSSFSQICILLGFGLTVFYVKEKRN